jgi:hypothetical protein
MMKTIPLPAFADNDRWMLHDGAKALVVDPDDAAAARAALDAQGFELPGILVTHPCARPAARVDVEGHREVTAAPRHRWLAGLSELPADTQRGHASAPGPRNPSRAARVGVGYRDIGAHTAARAAGLGHLRPSLRSTIVDALRA